MRRFAAHQVYYKGYHSLSFIEIDDDGHFAGIFPIVEETAHTAFINGAIVMLPIDSPADPEDCPAESWMAAADSVSLGDRIRVCRLRHISPAKPDALPHL